MSRLAHRRYTGLVLLLLCTVLLIPAPALAAPALQQHPWQHCLNTAAQRIQIHPILLDAIVHAESRHHPWAFGWTDRDGIHHSWYATSLPEAKAMFAHLTRIKAQLAPSHAHFDVGLAQLNSKNIARIARQHGIRPVEVLDPCVNLHFSAQILEELLARHGYTWQAIAG
ncbi:MAG: transglycosylase SLT domain-containing protein [Nitrospiraceae bacterium]|nr:transglycosylase SLT domain-containing protein [Nitrospiraceae bacterium]